MVLESLRVRTIAGSLHLAVSVLIASCAGALIFLGWYPGVLSVAQGVNQLVLIMISVDVVIGPLVTFLVYVPGKRGLAFDLAIIAMLQTLALLYGMRAIHDGRPAYVVYNIDRFDVIAVKEISPISLSRAGPKWAPQWLGARWVAARLPADANATSDVLFDGYDLPQLPEYFVPLEDVRATMIEHLHPLDELRKINERDPAFWSDLFAELGRSESELGYLPMKGNASDGAVLLDRVSGEVLGVRMLTPSFAPARKQGRARPIEVAPGAPEDIQPATSPMALQTAPVG